MLFKQRESSFEILRCGRRPKLTCPWGVAAAFAHDRAYHCAPKVAAYETQRKQRWAQRMLGADALADKNLCAVIALFWGFGLPFRSSLGFSCHDTASLRVLSTTTLPALTCWLAKVLRRRRLEIALAFSVGLTFDGEDWSPADILSCSIAPDVTQGP